MNQMDVIDSLTPLIYNMIKRKFYWVTSNNPDLKYDLVQVGYLSILRALPLYDETKAKLSTYMYRVIFRDMLKFACDWYGYEGGKRQFKARHSNLSIQALTESMYDDETADECKNGFLGIDDEAFFNYELDDVLKNTLTHYEYMVVTCFYFYGMNQGELADILKVSKQAISFQHRNAIKKLRKAYNI